MARFFISNIYCTASLVTMAQILLTGVRDTYQYAVISEDDIIVLINWLERRQSEILEKNRRLKAVNISLCKPYNDDFRRYINIGDGHVSLIRINERTITNKSK